MLRASDSVRLGMIQAAAELTAASQSTRRDANAQTVEANHGLFGGPPPHHHGATEAASGTTASASASTQNTGGMASAAADAQPSQAQAQSAEDDEEQPIEELVNTTVIHLDKPIEHIPAISPPELKLIGRCVTFKGDTTIAGETCSFYYEGLVGTINKETVMLIHVRRYTEEDFQVHKLERKHASAVNDSLKSSTSEGTGAVSSSGLDGMPYAARGAAREEIEANDAGNALGNLRASTAARSAQMPNGDDLDFDHESIPFTEHQEKPDPSSEVAETHAEATSRMRSRMRQQKGTMGPIPYVTFSRSHIHHVEFGVDPQSSFYSIFQDPTRHNFDMQCLRMFVRRYIIHTSQGNNPRCVPLRAFITTRCKCPNLDNDLLVRTTREELAHLIKIDRDVRRTKKRKEQIRRNVLRSYRAPNGLFRRTGVLFLTHLPQQTLTVASMEIMVTLVLLLYTLMTILTAEPNVIGVYLTKIYSYVFATVVVGLVATACTSLHALRMVLPLHDGIYLVGLRVFFTVAVIVCSVVTMIAAGAQTSYERFFTFLDNELIRPRLCAFYSSHRCSGIEVPCTSIYAERRFCACHNIRYDNYPCQVLMITYVQRGLIPILCLSFILFTTALFDGYMHLRLFHIAHLLQRRR
ncbi:hypothetical protein LSCM1_02332 [Leishmania martiniquensis]|uniref:Uncharacterized protein n=1 Tax=Leishmania martiniquensis TaxID=1580590 RepID=A0A836KDE2_9TRYP|nr:hypothetical protein LSCM1_02332 [Leishmania martiniquensis]